MSFPAFQVAAPRQRGEVVELSLEDLEPDGLLIQVEWSSINYKDALGGLALGKIYKKFPIIGGIDLAGTVAEDGEGFKKGQRVLVHGCGLGEERNGGYAAYARVPEPMVLPLPGGLTGRKAMVLGTAGFTAALAAHRLLVAGQKPEKGPILVSGASGGVGMVAVALMAHLGFEVWAMSGKEQSHELLKTLGATRALKPEEFVGSGAPLESVTLGGAIDNVGGEVLTQMLASTQLWGSVASVGLAQSPELKATVMPFILRGVSLLGVSSNNTPQKLRALLWEKLAAEWMPPALEHVPIHEVGLDGILPTMQNLIDRKSVGRTIVKI